MKKIGFIDYFLDNWHADNCPLWIRDERRGNRWDVAYAWAYMDKEGGVPTDAWCRKFGVARAASIEEVVEKSDALVVLSPNHPEMHEKLCDAPLRSGKPVYVDKTFAPDAAAARRMFDLARAHNTPLYSTSALRYAAELKHARETGVGGRVVYAAAQGGGPFVSYAIHQIEMIITAMGAGAKRAMAVGAGGAAYVVYEYSDGRACSVSMLPWSGFRLTIQDESGAGAHLHIDEDFWGAFADDMLLFFDTGKPPVSAGDTVAAVAMVEAGVKALETPGVWVDVPSGN